MERTINERLFFKMMRFSHQIKRDMMHAPHGHGMHGHGACPKMPGPGPHMTGMHGPHCHGKHGHGHGMHMNPMKRKAFAQARLLSLLTEHEDGVRQRVLAEEMRINPSSTSELISKLESEGYVARTVDPDDKRATLIALTEVGRARAYEMEDERNEKFAKVFEPLTEKEKEQLLKLLEKLVPTPERPTE